MRSTIVRGSLPALATALFVCQPASAGVFGPAGVSNSHGGTLGPTPSCAMRQAWQKSPGPQHVNSIAFTGSVSCTALPSYLALAAKLTVVDETAPTDPPVIEQSDGFDSSDTPGQQSVAFVFTPTLTAPKLGHVYLSTFDVAFDGGVVVSTMPGEGTQSFPAPGGDPGPGPAPPAISCRYVQRIAVL